MKESPVSAASGVNSLSKIPAPQDSGAENVPLCYQAATTKVAAADLSPLTRLEVMGKDAAKFLSNLCTNDIVKMPVGTGCEAFFLNAKGRILDYGRVFSLEGSIAIELEPARGPAMMQHLDRFLFREDAKLHDRTADQCQLHLTGPRSAEILGEMLGPEALSLGLMNVRILSFQGIAIQIRRLSRSIQSGYDILLAKEHEKEIWNALIKAGAAYGLQVMGPRTLEILRVELGLPRYDIDISEENLAQEVDRNNQAISFTKGCYIGQETVARLDALGHVNRVLRGLKLPEGQWNTSEVFSSEGKSVGRVTSSAHSPRLGPIGLAMVRTAVSKAGTEVRLGSPTGPVATVSELPMA